jgi:hypothetical protein
MSYTVIYASMQVAALTPEFHEKTCNYWYTVTNGATAHTAFTTKRGLMRWLDERGLKLDGELPEATGEFATMRVIGEYRSSSHMDEGEFYAVQPVVITAAMSNGRYTLALIDEAEGVRTVHTLNPNVKTRIEVGTFPGYAIMRDLMN